ncbi:uncharacterized protein LOC126293193 isoform X2 [Schistocerca gregaria]|uniref:uncharacterized protein LOC126293193 isoform X2 n=1 Tax=Schistocerca gregaria TaxID=7010 RepID=UPI00211DBBBC|nr:uncharacterized protein LOC126293193 isoform X2 [Schistocerca gregaria]
MNSFRSSISEARDTRLGPSFPSRHCAQLSEPPCDSAGMAECECEGGVPFDSLPDEIIINIFSYFSFNELVDNVQNVCRRWKRLAHAPTLWLNKEYAIRGRRWRLQGRSCCGVLFSECRHCKCVKSDVQVLQEAGTMPQLHRLTIMRTIRSHILCSMCTGCPNLTNLQIQSCQNFPHSTLEHIFEKCPKIKKLIVPASMLGSLQFLQLLASLEHLTCLVVFEDLGNTVPVGLHILADGCPRLEEIHTNWYYYDRQEMEYFLHAKKHTLTSATLRWTSGLVGRWCLVNLLKECDTPLKRLRLVSFHVKPSMEATAFEALSGLHSLEELHAEGIHAQNPKLLTRVFQLELSGCNGLGGTAIARLHSFHFCTHWFFSCSTTCVHYSRAFNTY